MDPSRDQPDYSDSSSSTGCISELISSGLDQTESVSLPPLPFSLQAQLESPDKNHNQNQAMSMKELDSKLNNLRRENFDLKLRLFYERQNKGPSRPESEGCILDKNSNLAEQYRMLIIEHEHQMKAFQKTLLDLKREKDSEIQGILLEKEALTNDLQVVTSLCKSFINHIHQLRTFWTLHPPEVLITEIKMVDFLYNWLNSSEDLLNSATVLIGDECEEYPERFSADTNNPLTEVDHSRGNSITQQFNLGESDKRDYLKFKSLLYNATSDSEDNWSEPDRSVSKSRIGIELAPLPDTSLLSRSLQKPKSKRHSGSGISSLGLSLSESGQGISDKTHKKRKNVINQQSSDTQTLLLSEDIETLISCFQNQKSKTLQSQSCQTENSADVISSHNSTQTDFVPLSHSSSQTPTTELSEKYSQTLYTSHDDIVFKSKFSNSVTTQVKTKHGCLASKPRNEMPIHAKDSSLKASKSMQNFSCCKAVKSLTKKTSQVVTPTLELPQSLFVFTNKSQSSNISDGGFKTPRSQPFTKPRSSSFDQTLPSLRIDKTSPDASSSTKLFDLSLLARKRLFKEELQNLKSNSLLSSKGNLFLSEESDRDKDYQLPSPDLGIGDSDPDGLNPLRAYLPLSYYQLLRGHLNQISSHLNGIDNLYRDRFVLQSITDKEFSSALKLALNNLNQIISFSRSICKNFVIDDENSLHMQLEKIIARKENMEKIIARQLKKTDKLLKKAKTNLKDV